jgi:hypothetical protein
MDNFKQIEKYLDGSMSSDEKKKFEESLTQDKNIAADLVFHQEINEAISDDDIVNFRQTVKNIIDQNMIRSRPIKRPLTIAFKISLAAAVFLFLMVGLFRILTHHDLPELYSSFYEPYKTDISTRTLEDSKKDIQLPYILYQNGDYEASYEILTNYLLSNSNDQSAHFYLGLNALELNRPDIAIEEFSFLEQDTLSPFELHARWYLTLTYLKTGDLTRARKLLHQLIEEKNIYTAKAKKIIRKLNVHA